ncbi:hypothetical protein M0654_06580 [Rhizobium sp. NTR19]|uniref:DUF3606 domain-containing protein n=1 Tax=Neorhizobium turbinariae TaxID=2937795 RepID=A0ABT0IP43_9HYPH|nr:hypothetical protein [Neorhizobium turbinariae]MCK8779650.1 hypothetical protein [Neorhizobium turbinariae]
MPDASDGSMEEYGAEDLARRYKISIQQARRYIRRFGNDRAELDLLLAAANRTPRHRVEEIERTVSEVTFG